MQLQTAMRNMNTGHEDRAWKASWEEMDPIARTAAQVSSVVFALVQGDNPEQFLERSKCLHRALSGSEPYDQVVFHEGGFPLNKWQDVVGRVPGLRFVNAQAAFSLPKHVRIPADVAASKVEGSLGYRQMVHASLSACILIPRELHPALPHLFPTCLCVPLTHDHLLTLPSCVGTLVLTFAVLRDL